MLFERTKIVPILVNRVDGELDRSYQAKIVVKVYPKFLGRLLAWFKIARSYHAERETYYLSKSARQAVFKQVKAHCRLDLLPQNCPERIVDQIFMDTIFKTQQNMQAPQLRREPAILNDKVLLSLNKVSDIPVVRKNDFMWIAQNVKPGSILMLNTHEDSKINTWAIRTAQSLMRRKDLPKRHTAATHALICVAPGKFAEAIPSAKGDQVRIVEFNQITMDLGLDANAEYQVYEPRLEEMTPENRALWTDRMQAMVNIAQKYAVRNTPKKIDSTFMQWVRSVIPKTIVPSKLKYNYRDAVLSVLKRNNFNLSAKARVFKEYASRKLELDNPLTWNGKRKFFCSSFVSWLLQGMQHKELDVALEQRLHTQGMELELPVLLPYPEAIERPEKLDLDPNSSKEQKKLLKKEFKGAVSEYNSYIKEINKIHKKNGLILHAWAKQMAKTHGELLDHTMECQLDARFTNPMELQNWLHGHSDVFHLAARIIPEQKIAAVKV